MVSNRSPKVSGSCRTSSFPAPRKYAAMAGSARYLVSEVLTVVLERSFGDHDGRSSVTHRSARRDRYSYTVLMDILALPDPLTSSTSVDARAWDAVFLDRDLIRALIFLISRTFPSDVSTLPSRSVSQ